MLEKRNEIGKKFKYYEPCFIAINNCFIEMNFNKYEDEYNIILSYKEFDEDGIEIKKYIKRKISDVIPFEFIDNSLDLPEIGDNIYVAYRNRFRLETVNDIKNNKLILETAVNDGKIKKQNDTIISGLHYLKMKKYN